MSTFALDTWKSHIHILRALLSRNFTIFYRHRLRGLCIDNITIFAVSVITFGFLFPALGMPTSLIAPIYIGSITSIMFWLGFSHSMRFIFDLNFTHVIDFQLLLPLPKTWLFATYILYTMLEMCIISVPLCSLGILALYQYFVPLHPQLLLFILLYILILFFFSILFLFLSLHYDFSWFMSNIWPRRLSILFSISTNFLVWKQVYYLKPNIGYLLLFNPTTYATEGLRSTLLNSAEYIAPWWCILGLIVYTIPVVILLFHSIKKRLDPV